MAMSKVTVHARGIGGVEEMRDHMDDNTVMFGLLRFVFGHGSFARVKYVFVHLNGESCPIVKRGRFNSKKGDASEKIGSCHTELEYTNAEEITVDGVLDHLYYVCVSDGDLGKGTEAKHLAVTQMKKDMEVMLEKAKEDMEKLQAAKPQVMRPPGLLMWKDMQVKPSWSECLQMVRADMGPFNWMLLKPDVAVPEVLNAGSGSVTQMRCELDDKEVCYGMLRMGFGKGQFRRSKWIYIHWSGEYVPAMKRGQFNAVDGDMKLLLGSANVAVSAQSKEEFTLEEIIKKVQRSVVTDGDASDTELFSMDAFLEALAEEHKQQEAQTADEAASAATAPAPEALPPVPDAIESVRSDREPYNWLLCSFG